MLLASTGKLLDALGTKGPHAVEAHQVVGYLLAGVLLIV